MSRPNVTRLAEWFIAHVRAQQAEGAPAPDVHAVWSKLLQDAWFQQALESSARRVTAIYRLDASCADDVFDEVVLRLHAALETDVTLAYDADEDPTAFESWLRKFLWHRALTVARSIASRRKATQAVMESDRVFDGARTMSQAIDLNYALRRLPNELRAVAYGLAKECSLAEISRMTGIKENRVKKLAEQVRKRLAKRLGLEGADGQGPPG